MYAPAHNDLGLVYYQLNRLYEAAWEFKNAANLVPSEPQPLNNLGLVMEKAGRLPEAEQSFSKAVALDPDNVECSANLARIRIRRGERDQTTRDLLERIILKDPRADWVQWTQFNLSRLRPAPDDSFTPKG